MIYSQNPLINEIILELIEGSDFDINCFSQLEDEFTNNYNKAYDQATKKAQLESLYTLLLRGANNLLNDFPINYKYTKEEITEIIFKKNCVRIDILQKTINYLTGLGCIITDKK